MNISLFMSDFPTVWVANTADSLLDLAIKKCIECPLSFCQYSGQECKFELREGLSLPEEICERMLVACKTELTKENLDSVIQVFKETGRTRLRRVDLSDSKITDQGLHVISNHRITELNISGCKFLSLKALKSIDRLWNGLQSLNIGSSVRIFFDPANSGRSSSQSGDEDHLLRHCMGLLHPCGDADDISDAYTLAPTSKALELPMLRNLIIHKLHRAEQNMHFMSLMKSAQYLTHLDLSKCELQGDLNGLLIQKHLISLILCDVQNVREIIPAICHIKTLRHLDISNTGDQVMLYENPNQTLKCIVESLENLVSLDISGTNLAGGRTQERYSKENGVYHEESLTDIPGLASRVNRPLEFLGLLNTAHDACYRHHIPAKKVAGDASEEQILTAGQVYCSRKPMIQKVLNDLFQVFRFSTCANIKVALDVVMEAMRRHLKVKHIQVSGSASLFYIVKGDNFNRELFNIKIRRKIIKILIDAMFSHHSDATMLRNGCLTLIHFKIPEDVFFYYERLATLLLLIVAREEQEDFVQRVGVYLLNSLACQVDGIEKKLVGDRGAITIMLQVIERRLLRNVCDEVMETAWSTMWNVTDETPINCARFLDNKGMDLFLGCLDAFPDKPDLLRNMMGLLGNVAEVEELRSFLMKDEYLVVFSELLHSKSDGIEVSYNAAGILSHIASDGPEPWVAFEIKAVQRSEVLAQMVEAIESWSLETKRNINYRSFKPILRLVTVEHTPEAQHWAMWALANLTTVYPEKYCSLLKEEGGIELIKSVLHCNEKIRYLGMTSICNCLRYEGLETINSSEEEEDDSDDESDTIDIT